MAFRYLGWGYVALDQTPEGARWGGSVLYGALTALRLGWQVQIATALPPHLASSLPIPPSHLQPVAAPTCFVNRYDPRGGRSQLLLSWAGPLVPPRTDGEASVVHWAPIARELPLTGTWPPGAFRLATPQGWLRSWSADGRVWPVPLSEALLDVLAQAHLVVLSQEDLAGDPEGRARLTARCPLWVETRGAQGALLYRDGRVVPIPAFPARAVDPTGAGDVFAVAMAIRMAEGADPEAAARFAAAAAAAAVEGVAWQRIPIRARVLARMEASSSG